jgi:hypothetical protein
MLNDLTQEITKQSDSLVGLAPKIQKLNDLLETPMISDELIQEYHGTPVAQRDNWVKRNASKINTNVDPEIESLMIDLIVQMSAVFGSAQRVQSLMVAQQQQSLQAAKKPEPKATAPVESLE